MEPGPRSGATFVRPRPSFARPVPAAAATSAARPAATVAASVAPTRGAALSGIAPEWAYRLVLAYLVVDFGRPQNWFPVLGLLRPGILVMGSGIVAVLLYRDRLRFPARLQLIITFLALMAFGVPFATNSHYAYLATKDLTLLFLGALLPLTAFVDSYERVRKLVLLFVFLHVPLSIYGITHSGFGIGAFLVDENDFCLALDIAIPYAFFGLYFVKSFKVRLMLVFTLGLLVLSATSTMSRGGFLGLIAVAAVCWLASPKKLMSLVVFAMLSLPLAAMIPDKYWKEMQTIETADSENDTGGQRLYLWGLGWRMFLDHPIFGVGPTNYQYNNDKYETAYETGKGLHVWGKAAHSIYFTLLPELGVTGATVFVSLLLIGWRDARRIRKRYAELEKSGTVDPERLEQLRVLAILTRANGAALIGYLVAGSFLSVLYYPHLWLQVSISVAINRAFDEIAASVAAGDPTALTPTSPTAATRPARAVSTSLFRPRVAATGHSK